jgi:hypothetical protein
MERNMNLLQHNLSAIEAVTAAIDAAFEGVRSPIYSYPEAAEIIDDLRWQADRGFSNSDATLAARAIKADMADGDYACLDGEKRVHGNLTDAAQEMFGTRQFYVELYAAMSGNDEAKLAFAKWLCTVYSAEVAAYVRRLVNDEIES